MFGGSRTRHFPVSRLTLVSVLAALACLSCPVSTQAPTPAPAGVLYIQVLINGTSYWKAFNFSSVAGTLLASDTSLGLVAIPNVPPAVKDDSLLWWQWILIGGAFLILMVILVVVVVGFYAKPITNTTEDAAPQSGAYCKVIQVDLMSRA